MGILAQQSLSPPTDFIDSYPCQVVHYSSLYHILLGDEGSSKLPFWRLVNLHFFVK
uniref:Ovule protein n=1 Tax=Heterorhabditis bacteriophora TaxID=37862 RepID=A0A1I7WHG5_HETBA